MNRTEMVAAVRLQARLSDSDTDYTAARIGQELTDTQRSVFGTPIVEARAGAWLKQIDTEADGTRYRFRLPYRSFAMESVELVGEMGTYEIIGDKIVFEEPPASDGIVRVTYYLSPSLIAEEQSAGVGEVTDVNESTRQVTVDTGGVVNRVTGSPIATGDRLDVIHPNGWHELSVVGAVATVAGTLITFAVGTDLSDVEVGDVVRAAEQSDWPCLPDDFHRALCDVTAARILRARRYESKAQAIELQAAGDIARFVDALEPRVKDATPVVVPNGILLRGGGGRRGSASRFGGW